MVALVKLRSGRHLCGFVTTLCVLLFNSANEGLAQTANQAQLTREQAPSAFPSTVPPSGAEGGNVATAPGDADLGEQQILKRTDEYQPFTISAGAPFYWTSNVALTRSGEQSDFVVAPAAAAFYEPRITNTLYGLIDVREQLFYYDRFDDFNFGSFDVEVGLRYLVPQWHNLLLRLEYDYNRLTDGRGIWAAAKHQCDLSPAKRLRTLSWLLGSYHPFLFHQCRGNARSAPVL